METVGEEKTGLSISKGNEGDTHDQACARNDSI